MAVTQQGIGNALSAGVTVGFSTGNPIAGVLAGTVSLFASSAADDATQEYNNSLAAIAALNEDRQKVAAVVQKEANAISHELSGFAAERERKSMIYKGAMARAGVTAFASQTGLTGSSAAMASAGRLKTEEAFAIEESKRSQLKGDELFDLAQLKLDALVSDDPYDLLGGDQVIAGLQAGTISYSDVLTSGSIDDILADKQLSDAIYDEYGNKLTDPDKPYGQVVTSPGTAAAAQSSDPNGGGEVVHYGSEEDRIVGAGSLSSSLLGY